MAGKITGTILSLVIMTYTISLIIFYFLYINQKGNVEELNYGVSEVVATSGILTRDTYTYLRDSADKSGDFLIKLKLEKQVKPGVYDTYFEEAEIVDRHLQIGDRLTIYLEDKTPSMFGRLINSTVLNFSSNRYADAGIKSIKTAVVAKNARNLVKGYDVIADIRNKNSQGRFTANGVAILVTTKQNTAGKYYGKVGHAYFAGGNDNLIHGDTEDEKDCRDQNSNAGLGMNYIFDNGDFLKEVIYYRRSGSQGPDEILSESDPDRGAEKLIKYIQQ